MSELSLDRVPARLLRNPDYLTRLLHVFKGVVELVCPDEEQGNWVFRGQSNASHSLQPSIARNGVNRLECEEMEAKFYHRFRHLALMHVSSDDVIMLREAIKETEAQVSSQEVPVAIAEEYVYLGLMQHFGIPTRLLDWSESPWIALYFACSGSLSDDGMVFALNQKRLDDKLPDSAKVPIKILQKRERADENSIQLVQVPHAFRRIASQLGVFTMSEDPTLDHAMALGDRNHGCLHAMKIPAELKASMRRLLRSMNIRHSTVFPGLEGLARTLRQESLIE